MGDTPRSEPPASAVRRAGGSAARPGRPASRAEPAEPTEPGRRPDAAGRAEPGGRAAARRRIGIRELRQHASIYVDLAERGYTVDITNRGRLVAQLVPVLEAGSPLERLIAAGILEPAEEPGGVADIEPYPAATRPPAGEQR
jgi:antitoxin (DNA-binding transcriptional repressor) of toxin-antitoxin stability system